MFISMFMLIRIIDYGGKKMVNWKEVAKFFSGFAAFETVGHLL